MSEFKEIRIDDLIKENRPICYGVLKPGEEDDLGVYLIKINDINKNHILNENGLFKITSKLDNEFKRSKLNGNEILVSIQGTIGRCCIVPFYLKGSNISRTIARLDIKHDYDIKYIYQYLKSQIGQKLFKDSTSGTTRDSLNIGILRDIKIIIPKDKPKQTRIAEILSTADEAIAHTEVLIAKYQRIKTGLMQVLLTKGIDENGNIRSKATHKFVVKIGIEVPEEWEVVSLSYFIKKLESGVSVNSNDKPAGSGQYGVLKTSALSGCIFSSIQNKTVDDIEIKRLKCPVRKGSIIISRMNTPDLVGENALVENEFDNLFLPDRLWQTVFQNIEELNVFWLSKLLSSIKYRQKISFQATGTSGSMKNITKNDFLQIFIPKPDINEQDKIAKIFESVNNNETKLNNNLIKLQSLKTGLMQDLLSGKVRVDMDNKN